MASKLKVPLFSRSSFRTPKKPPRRKAGSLPNIANLDDSLNFSVGSISLSPGDTAAVSMKLGDHDIFFENGQWMTSGGKGTASREYTQLQQQTAHLREENTLLQKQNTELHEENDELQKQNTELHEENDHLQKQVTEIQEENSQLQSKNLQVHEESNLLKYKVELLLDMLTSSSADFYVLQKEMEALKKSQAQPKKK